MSYEHKEDMDYLIVKGLLSIIYSENFDYNLQVFNDFLVLEKADLEYLIGTIKHFSHWFDEGMKANVLRLVDYFRNQYVLEHPEEKEEVFELCNKVLGLIFYCDGSQVKPFVINETVRHYPNIVRGVFKTEELYAELKNIFINDFYILLSHSQYFDDESFENQKQEFVQSSHYYIASMYGIIDEHPAMLNDPVFVKRLKEITELLGDSMEQPGFVDFAFTKKKYKRLYKNYCGFLKEQINI